MLAVAVAGVAVVTHHGHGAHTAPGTSPVAADRRRPVQPAFHVSIAAQRAAIDRLIAAGRPVYCGGTSKPLVALTFDDGPGPYSRHTLQVLRRNGVRATFFLVAKEVVGWPGLKDVPAEEADQGAVGDHTYDHVSLDGLTWGELHHEVADARQVISAAAGGKPVRLFRPPFGAHDAASDAEVHAQDMLEVLWSVDSGDSTGATADRILATVKRDAGPGSIVLLHENRGTTRKALPAILDALRRKGLRPVTVPELLAADPPTAAQLASGSCS
ncbi:MAG TPA: polysaccharide deacetylase family protein [Actinomycetota bacterium]|jgi:peptidoglycan/xylan/chitin deacetylase (PgdA/CDA1 family)